MKEAFNIKVGYGEKEVTLTILPHQEGYYKVIYFGGMMGGVICRDGEWELLNIEEIESDGLPLYVPDLKGERLEVLLDEITVDVIGNEIELNYLEDED